MIDRTQTWQLTGACLLTALGLAGCLDPADPGNLVPRTVVEDPALPRLELADTTLHAEAFGEPSAPIVMVLHGGPGSDYRAMLPLAALADDGYRVVFWDQRGTGLSERHDADSFSFDSYRDDLQQVIDHHTVVPSQPLVFIGQSWGAMYATWFINEHGDAGGRVRGAVLSEPGAFTRAQLDDYLDRLNGGVPLTGERINDGTWSRQFLSPADHARADYLLGMLAFGGWPSDGNDPANPAPFWRHGAVAQDATLALVEDGFDWTTDLHRFPGEVLFLRGDRNTVQTLEHQQELAAAFPNATIETIAGTGHELIWEKPADYLAHTRAYFDRIDFDGVTP
jgi:proline iminopeptidase